MTETGRGHIKCPSCGKEVEETVNFCVYCSTKIRETCRFCWVRKKDNYNCGESKCPGRDLFMLEKLRAEIAEGFEREGKRNMEIEKEHHEIGNNMVFKETKKVDVQLVEKAILKSLSRPVQLDPNSLARRLQPEQNDE